MSAKSKGLVHVPNYRRGETKRTPELEEALCHALEDGVTLRAACRTNLIHYGTVYNWMDSDPAFAQRIARARDIGDEAVFEECKDIADNVKIGETVEYSPNDNVVKIKSGDMLEHRKLQIWTRLQILQRRNWKKYGGGANSEGAESGKAVTINGGLPDA